MDKAKRAKLEAAGWKIGSVQDFLELTDEEAEIIEIRLSLAAALKQRRLETHLS